MEPPATMDTREAFTTLAEVKDWLGVTSNETDKTLQRLIYMCTQGILAYLNRDTFLYSQRLYASSGVGGSTILLPAWPVHSVSAVQVGTLTVPAAASEGAAGFRLEPIETIPPGNMQEVVLNGFYFTPGGQNIRVTYMAGYAVVGEQHAAAASVTVNAPYGEWVRDEGVVDTTTGVALVKVASNPALGEYALGATAGQYVFNALQGGTVAITYSYVPFAIADACIEWVAERYRYRSRIGERTRSLSGQVTASYDLSDMPDVVKNLLANYRRVVPI